MPSATPPPFDATDTVWIWDPERGRIVWATPAAVAFWGDSALADLRARPFLPDDPNALAMNALLDAPRPEGEDADADDREATLTFFPDGAPLRLFCRGRVRRLDRSPGGLWLAIHATPLHAPSLDAESAATREALLLENAETAFALIDPSGAPILLNAAARRLFRAPGVQDAKTSLFDRYRAPSRAHRAASAAMLRGAFSHTAELIAQPGQPGRALILYRSVLDPVSGETLLSLEATPRPERGPSEDDLLHNASDTGSPPPGDARVAVILFDLHTLQLRNASAGAAAMLGAQAVRRGAALADLFPEQAQALGAAADELRSGSEPLTLDLPLGAEVDRGPWGAARLTLTVQAGAPMLMLTLLDLGPERRRMLLDEQERRAEAAALASLQIGLVFLDAQGRLRRADAAAATALGLPPAALAQRIQNGLDFTSLLAAPWGDRLRERLKQAFSDTPTVDAGGQPPIETVLTDVRGAPKLVRLAVSERLAFGRRLVCVAIDLAQRAAAPQELSAIAPAATPRAAEPGPINPRAFQAASHAFRTALTTIKGFAELARDDAAHPLAPRQRRRLNDIVQTASSLTDLVDRTFDRAASDQPVDLRARAAPADLAEITAAAAARNAARHPVWRADAPAQILALVDREDLDEGLDILLAEAADRGPTRITALRSGPVDDSDGDAFAAIELETPADAPSLWPPLTLRAAGLLIERAGGRLEIEAAEVGADPIVRMRILFAAVGV